MQAQKVCDADGLEAVEHDIDQAIVEERNREIYQIEQETSLIAEIMGHLSYMVSGQGETLEQAVENLEEAKENTHDATIYLEKALVHEVSSRGLLLDAGVIVAGTGLGALGFIASPIVGVPTLVAGVIAAGAVIVARRKIK